MIRRVTLFLRRSVVRTTILVLLFTVYGWVSVFAYALFYRHYIPPVQHISPLYLQFSSDCPEFLCSFPKALIPLRENGKALLTPSQQYGITLEMDMPESQVNQDQGLFMVNLSFYSSSSSGPRMITSSARSVMLRYKSPLVKIMQIVFFMLPLVLGLSEETQHLVVPLFTDFVESQSTQAEFATLTVETKRIHIYQASLRLDARFSGLRYMMYYWPLSTAVVSMGSIMFILCSLTSLFFLHLWGGPWWPDSGEDDDGGEAEAELGDRAVIGQAVQPEAGNDAREEQYLQPGQPQQIGARQGERNDDEQSVDDNFGTGDETTSIDDSDSDAGQIQAVRRRIVPSPGGTT